MSRPMASVAPKVRYSTAQGATLGVVKTQNVVALKGLRRPRTGVFANRIDVAGMSPRWG
jgi:hypothetical protein